MGDHRRNNGSEIQYLDLDLDSEMTAPNPKSPERSTTLPACNSLTSTSSSTVYKTVDFVKTMAFNQTRQDVEIERKSQQKLKTTAGGS